MYPNLYWVFKDFFGIEWNWLKLINSFGFIVALSFIAAAWILTIELRRKQSQGLLVHTEETITIGASASFSDLLINFILGFILGYKIIGAFVTPNALDDPQGFILSAKGNLLVGMIGGLFFAGLKWWEKNKQKLAKPEQRILRIWPQDRVGDLVVYAAIFGFLGAKIFHNLENWDDFVKDPIGSLLSFSGLTFYGGLICAAVAIYFYGNKNKIPFIHLCDSNAPGLMLAYGVGRLGCQVSGDGDWGILNSAFVTDTQGHIVKATADEFQQHFAANTNFYTQHFGSLDAVKYISINSFAGLPNWLFAYNYPHNVISEGVSFSDCAGPYCNYLPIPVFPTPFYEAVVCILLFVFLMMIRNKIKAPGKMFAIYLILNGVERFFIEKIRVNTTYSIFGFHPTQAEIISSLLVVSGIILFWLSSKKEKKIVV